MSVNAPSYDRMFGNGATAEAPTDGGKAKRPKAQVWLNAGYETGEAGTDSYKFVSLPVGIPIDLNDAIEIKSSNTDYAEFQSARNGLLEMVAARAAELKPGEEAFVNLKLQLRRINDTPVAPSSEAGVNRFVPADLKI